MRDGKGVPSRAGRVSLTGPLVRIVLVAACSSAAHAAASPLSVYGYNPRGVGMGEAQVAAADDGSAAYHNPALLARKEQSVLGVGMQHVRSFVRVDPVEWSFGEENEPFLPQDFLQWNLGIVAPVGGKFKKRLAFGLTLSLPHGYIVRVQSTDTATPQFPLYQGSAQKLTLIPALAYRPLDWLSVGVGMQNLAGFVGGADVQIDLFTRRVLRRTMLVDFVTRNSWIGGIAVGPFAGLTIGASFRQEIGLDYILPAVIDIQDVGVLEFRLKGTGLFSPHELTVGAALELPPLRSLLTFDLTHGWWSKAPSPQAMTVIETSGEVLEGLGMEGAFDLCSDQEVFDEETGTWTCTPLSPGYTDNLVPKIGLEVRPFESLAVRAGYRFWPTPIPNQVGRTNYLDASSHHFSLGLSYGFQDPFEVMSLPVFLELSVHTIRMRERAVDKGGDGSIAYRFGGSLFQTTAALRYQF